MNRNLLLTLGVATLAFAACRKDAPQQPASATPDVASAVDNNLAESMFNDVVRQADQAADNHGLRSALDACVDSVSIDTNVMPHTMLIAYGTVNCTGDDGRTRRGNILVTFTGRYRATGTVITITPQDYYVDDNKIQGIRTVTNLGPDAEGHLKFSVSGNGTVTAPDNSWTSSHTYDRVRTWIAGEHTPTPWDDVYLITGTGSGVNRNGRAYALTITQPLRVDVGCWQPVSGRVEIIPEGRPTRYVDYGNGECDGTYTVTVNGVTTTIH